MQLREDRKESFLLAPGWLMGAWNKDGERGYWHIDRPHAVIAHMVGIGGKHQQGKKLGFKVQLIGNKAQVIGLATSASLNEHERLTRMQ